MTPLLTASLAGRVDADANRATNKGTTPIAYDDGVDARLIRKLPLSPLAIAEEKGHAAVVALLEEHQK